MNALRCTLKHSTCISLIKRGNKYLKINTIRHLKWKLRAWYFFFIYKYMFLILKTQELHIMRQVARLVVRDRHAKLTQQSPSTCSECLIKAQFMGSPLCSSGCEKVPCAWCQTPRGSEEESLFDSVRWEWAHMPVINTNSAKVTPNLDWNTLFFRLFYWYTASPL